MEEMIVEMEPMKWDVVILFDLKFINLICHQIQEYKMQPVHEHAKKWVVSLRQSKT